MDARLHHNITGLWSFWASLATQLVKKPPAMRETWVWSLGLEDPLEKEKATHSSILAWRIPWTVHGVAKSQTRLSSFHFGAFTRVTFKPEGSKERTPNARVSLLLGPGGKLLEKDLELMLGHQDAGSWLLLDHSASPQMHWTSRCVGEGLGSILCYWHGVIREMQFGMWQSLCTALNISSGRGRWVFPGVPVVKNPAANAGNTGLIPGSQRSPGEGNGYPLKFSCLVNPMDRGAWQATVHGVTKTQTWFGN